MSVPVKRYLDREGSSDSSDSSSKKRKIKHDESQDTTLQHNPKNLLKNGQSIPSNKAYQRKRLTLGIYIAPIDTVDPLAGVGQQLDEVLLSYIKEAKGILMGWRDARFLDSSARILDESPFSFSEVSVDTIVWRPKRGEQLEGKVKLMGPSHIGILILDTFNASIPQHLIPTDWTYEENFDGDDGYWKRSDGLPLQIDQTIHFTTVNIRKGANILNVEGSLLDSPEELEIKEEIPKEESTKDEKKAKKKKREKER